MVSPLASVLTVPFLELYALLWRAGVVQIAETRDGSRRARAGRAGCDRATS
jgi:hypothetical protein